MAARNDKVFDLNDPTENWGIVSSLNQDKCNLCQQSSNLWISFHLSSENCAMEEFLESLVHIVMAKVFKQCTLSLPS